MDNTSKTKKKVAFLVYSMRGGGTERVIATLLPFLNEAFELHLVLFNQPIEYELPEQQIVKYLRIESSTRLFRIATLPLVATRYYKYCKKENIQISMSFGILANAINCLVKSYGWKGQTILSERNFSSLQFKEATISNVIKNSFIKYLYPISDKIIVLSKSIYNNLRTVYGLKNPITIIYNPLDINGILKKIKQAPISSTSNFVFVHVGRFFPQKNHLLLLDAFSKLTDKTCELWLLGKGPLEEVLKKRVKQLGISKRVKFLGFQSNPYLYIHQADCFVLSSDFEGFPNVIAEALACQQAIIATDCSSGPREILAPSSDFNLRLKEEIELGEFGILTPVGNAELLTKAMELMMENETLREKYQKVALNRAINFKAPVISSQYIEVLAKDN